MPPLPHLKNARQRHRGRAGKKNVQSSPSPVQPMAPNAVTASRSDAGLSDKALLQCDSEMQCARPSSAASSSFKAVAALKMLKTVHVRYTWNHRLISTGASLACCTQDFSLKNISEQHLQKINKNLNVRIIKNKLKKTPKGWDWERKSQDWGKEGKGGGGGKKKKKKKKKKTLYKVYIEAVRHTVSVNNNGSSMQGCSSMGGKNTGREKRENSGPCSSTESWAHLQGRLANPCGSLNEGNWGGVAMGTV